MCYSTYNVKNRQLQRRVAVLYWVRPQYNLTFTTERKEPTFEHSICLYYICRRGWVSTTMAPVERNDFTECRSLLRNLFARSRQFRCSAKYRSSFNLQSHILDNDFQMVKRYGKQIITVLRLKLIYSKTSLDTCFYFNISKIKRWSFWIWNILQSKIKNNICRRFLPGDLVVIYFTVSQP